MATDIRPMLTAPSDRYADLPAHARDAHGVCVYCGDGPYVFATYDEYLDHFYYFEYEGAPGHNPESREDFEYVRDSCLA